MKRSGWRLPYIHATLKKKLIKAKNESFLNCDLAQYTSSTVSRAMVQKKKFKFIMVVYAIRKFLLLLC